MDTLSGSVERITFYNPENGYSVLRLRPESGRIQGRDFENLVTVVGNLPELAAGEHLRLQGKWITHPKHGLQFQVEICEQALPATLAGIRRYLGSGLVKGIGPRLAAGIVAHFGEQTLQVIDEQPQRLQEVPDIGPKRFRLIESAWQEQKQVKEIMLFLHSHNISTNLAVKIFKQYGEQSLQVVQSDPYRLARDIYGVGFKTADRIAQELGLPNDHPSRIEAGLVYTLNQSVDDGHVYLPAQELISEAVDLLEVPSEMMEPCLERLVERGDIRRDWLPPTDQEHGSQEQYVVKGFHETSASYRDASIYLMPLYLSECGLAERLKRLSSTLPTKLSDLPPTFVPLDPGLSGEQQGALRQALNSPLSILTGGPGTGKTTAIRALIGALESANKAYALASPTGRAAKRLSQATGRPASTIHRLLGFKPGEGFKHNAENPLKIDLLVVDEASMLDLVLANNLIKALEPGTHLLLVGDVDQLPSVGAGDVLRDIIVSGIAPVTRLSTIFRQAANSSIITNAHRINQGQMPIFARSEPGSNQLGADFYLFSAETPQLVADWVVDIVCQRIPQRFGFHPRDDIQVLSPMYRGPAGVDALNARLQAALNPAGAMKPEKTLFGQIFRPGDKVMQIQNNYDKDIFNGDIGYLFAINPLDHTLTVDFDGRGVIFDWSETDQLVLAYAVSVHKSQGSEFPAVVIPMVTAHYLMLQRNLLYTAVTRAAKLCVLVGSRRAIGIALHNDRIAHRNTALNWRLNSA